MFSNNVKIEKAAMILRADELDIKFVKVCLGDAFVYGFPKTLSQCLVNWNHFDFFEGFMLTSQRVACEC
jgi:hypothetical protein